jgi:hypothetical protein
LQLLESRLVHLRSRGCAKINFLELVRPLKTSSRRGFERTGTLRR